MRRSIRNFVVFLCASVLLACGGIKSKSDQLTSTLLAYSQALRWGRMSEAVGFLDPKLQAEKPVTSLELQRFEQLTVSGYREQTDVVVGDDDIARQVVEIEFINKHTQSPRSVIDQQRWRYDSETKRWVLISGLPDLRQSE
jgi:hypothetical protein